VTERVSLPQSQTIGDMRTAITIVSMLAGLASAAAQDAGDPRLGLDVARESCATCHAILRVEDRSPNPNAPSFSHIAKVPGMTAMALHVALQSLTKRCRT
jgi:mono/diheme cytochrome c family protein